MGPGSIVQGRSAEGATRACGPETCPHRAVGSGASTNPLEDELMAGRGAGPDFVESLARGLDVLACFDGDHRAMSLTEVATAAGLARPTARRLLLTLEELGFVRTTGGSFQLT